MKKKLLILTVNPVAKKGISSYLSSIFSRYLTIESARAADITPESLESAHCILFSTESVKNRLSVPLPPDIPRLTCMRTFNHTYLHKILQIPPGSSVYLVNDTQKNAEEVIRQLEEYGFSQYHFQPFYPGISQVSDEIYYAVTPGELHLVPSNIRTVIDIGNRVVDISTINEIIACFGLPTSLADEVTRNYMNHIVQVLKLSNQQLSRVLDLKQINQIILNNSSEGLCLLDQEGKIELMNTAFYRLAGLKEVSLTGVFFSHLLKEYGISYDFPPQSETLIERPGSKPFRLWFQKFRVNRTSEMYLVHASVQEQDAPEQFFPARIPNLCNFNHFVTQNPAQLHLLDTARRVSLNDFPIIIQGESGTEKDLLAQAIHRNSMRHDGPFISLNFSSLTPAGIETELLGCSENPARNLHRRIGAFEAAQNGTLLINGLQYANPETQQLLLNVLRNGCYTAVGSTLPHALNVRIIVTSTVDLYSLVREGRFLDDLFFYLNTVSLTTIPLRQRRGDIPMLLNFALKDAFHDPDISIENVLTENTIAFLKQYDWPGNRQEMKNLCSYFSCIYRRETIPITDLPGYILNQIDNTDTKLDITEKKILSLIMANPRIGRNSIRGKLLEEGISLSEGKIRNVLAGLSENGYIKVHRTRGGCEATELGVLMSRG